jgi:cbb3-type cytochrome oxidase subunit 3
MSLSDIVSNAGATLYAEIALVIFFLVFVGVVIYVVLRRKGAWEHERRLPLDHDEPADALEDKQR